MAQKIELDFYEDDDALQMSGHVNFPNDKDLGGLVSLTIRGLADWRHVPANVIHLNNDFISTFNMMEQSKKLSSVGLNWIGIKARSDVLLSYAIRQGRNGQEKVREQLNKFFRALGATSVSLDLEEDG